MAVSTSGRVRRAALTGATVVFSILLPAVGEAEEPGREWEHLELRAGGVIVSTQSSIALGPGSLGLALDPERILGLSPSVTTFRAEATVRIGARPRHRIDLSASIYRRSGTRTLERTVELGDQTYDLGLTLDSRYDVDVYQLKYAYSVFQDRRMDLGVGLGFYVMPIEFSVERTGQGETTASTSENLLAPVPVIHLHGDFAVSRRVSVFLSLDWTYLPVNEFTGRLRSVFLSVEWLVAGPFALGLGYDSLAISVESEARDSGYPGLDFAGAVSFETSGALLYGELRF